VKNVLRDTGGEKQRATFLELFFDLVFVFAVAQLSHLLLADLSLAGAAKTGFLLLVVWWAWIYTTWMANWFDPGAVAVRLVLLGGMLASLLMAIAIPEAFGDRALLFAAGYVALQVVRNAFIVAATDSANPWHRPFQRMWAWSSWVGAIWILGALLPEGAPRVTVWSLALVLDYAGPLAGHWTPRLGRTTVTDWQIEHSHFAERFQLFVIIVLGESIVIAGATAADLEMTFTRVLAIVIAFLVTAAVWWLYFDEVAEHSEDDLRAAADEGGRLGRDAFTYLHIPIVAGALVVAVANELVIAHPDGRLHGAELVVLAAGPVLYLVGHVAFRFRMVGTVSVKRLVAAGLITGAAALGSTLPALAAWAIVLLTLIALAAVETRGRMHTVGQRLSPPG
jgi:low temperature requirement protein LtrA